MVVQLRKHTTMIDNKESGKGPAKKKTRQRSTKEIPNKNVIEYGIHVGNMVKEAIEAHPTMSINKLSKIAGKRTGMWVTHKCQNPHFGNIYDLLFVSIELKVDLVSPLLKTLADYGVRLQTRITIEHSDKMKEEVSHYKELWERSKREIDVLLKLIEDKK